MTNLNSLFLGLAFLCSTAYAAPHPLYSDYSPIPPKCLPLENLHHRPLEGKIINKRYYAPKNVFSCRAEDFGQGFYYALDKLWDIAACVAFE